MTAAAPDALGRAGTTHYDFEMDFLSCLELLAQRFRFSLYAYLIVLYNTLDQAKPELGEHVLMCDHKLSDTAIKHLV